MVNISKIRHLPLRGDSRVSPDPQLRLYLLPDDRCQHQTEVKKQTRNPNYSEVFNFQVARDHLRQRVLRLSVYDHGKGRRGEVIGHVLYSLKDVGFGTEIWRDFETLSEVRVLPLLQSQKRASYSKGPVTWCNFSCNLQCYSTLGRCKIGKYTFPLQFANIFLTYQTFVTNLHLLRVELRCKLPGKLHRVTGP